MLHLNCKGRLLVSEKPVVMGILNITPDSFYTKGKDNQINLHLENASKMCENGASIIDIGGMSTRPDAIEISEQEECDRVLPVIEAIQKHQPSFFISVDTYRSHVAKLAVEAGADIVNDISAGNLDKNMIETVARLNVPYIAMHMKGTPQTMKDKTDYENLPLEILHYFIEKTKECRAAGIKDLIIDPGFGFAKNLNQNYLLLKNLHLFKTLELPILAGLSRKSMIYKLLNSSPEEALNGTTILNTLALQQGAEILRVHDVVAAKELVEILAFYQTF